jgi:UDP-N-acetylmuramoyl-tripeptide--D-alanyl-D-alanine ligase
MTNLWTSDEIAQATGGQSSGSFACNGVAFDSREIGPGDLFFAMKGEQADGHRFVENAFASGAAGAVVSEPVAHPHILVPDSFHALKNLDYLAQRVDAKSLA